MNLWILGPGCSLEQYKQHICKLRGKNVLTLHRTFPHVLGFDLFPKYWTWFDPDAAMCGLDTILLHNKNAHPEYLLMQREMQIILPSFLLTEDRHEFLKYAGGSPPWTNYDSEWLSYAKRLQKVKQAGVKISSFDAITTKHISENKEKYSELIKNFLDPEFRFTYDKMIIGTGLSFDSYFKKPGMHWDCLENKLTFLMLPMAQKMGAKNVFIAGFDGVGGRFYNPSYTLKDNTTHSRLVYAGIKPDDDKRKACASYHNLSYLKYWNDWTEYTGMKIWSVVEDEHCKTNEFVDYLPFEKALEMQDEGDM